MAKEFRIPGLYFDKLVGIMYKIIAFDCWGTLFTNTQQPHPFAVFAQELGYRLNDREYLKKFEIACMTDSDTIEHHIIRLLNDLQISPQPAIVLKLKDIMLGSIPTQAIYTDTAETLSELSQSYRLVMVSNSFVEGFDGLRQKYPINDWFSNVLLSYQLGTVKPSAEVFEALIAQTYAEASEVLMVGDNYYDDVVAANSAGIDAILLDRNNRYPGISKRKISALSQLSQYL